MGGADIPPETVLGFPAADIFSKQGAAALQALPDEQIARQPTTSFSGSRIAALFPGIVNFPFFLFLFHPIVSYFGPKTLPPFDKKLLEKTAYLLFFSL